MLECLIFTGIIHADTFDRVDFIYLGNKMGTFGLQLIFGLQKKRPLKLSVVVDDEVPEGSSTNTGCLNDCQVNVESLTRECGWVTGKFSDL